jgi:ferric-dicitrate binding protein FerR (iron transport regulator)
MSTQEKISTEGMIQAMAAADVLETFCQLPQEDQAKFSRWIGKARDDESHWRRINALLMALRTGPLQPSAPQATANYPEATG